MRAMSRPLFATALIGLATAFAPPASGDDAARLPLRFIDVVGRVSTAQGVSVEGVRVALEDASNVSAVTDASGTYTLSVPIEALGDPAKKTVTARIVAARPGWAFTLRNGQGLFALELRMQTRTDPPRCRVRSNTLQSVDAVAGAIRTGESSVVVANVDFVGEEGAPPSSRMSLRSEAVTIVGEAKEPESAEPAAARRTSSAPDSSRRRTVTAEELRKLPVTMPGATGVFGTPISSGRPDTLHRAIPADRSSTAGASPAPRPRIRRIDPGGSDDSAASEAPDTEATEPVKLPGPGITQTDASLIRRIETAPGPADLPRATHRAEDVLAREGDCACRIRGTIEIHPDHLLSKPLELIVALREAPAVRDTIQLFMGSPRAFELAPLRCGTWHVDVDAVAKRAFTIVSTDGRAPVDCREGGLRQLRIVLDPR